MKRWMILGLWMTILSATTSLGQTTVTLTRFEGQHITGVVVSDGFEVELFQGDQTSLLVEVPKEMESNLELNLSSEGVLQIGLASKKPFVKKSERGSLKAKVCITDIRTITLSGSAKLTQATPLKLSSLTAILSGASTLSGLDVEASDRVVLDLKGNSACSGVANASLVRCETTGSSSASLEAESARVVWSLSGASKGVLSGSIGELTLNAGGASGVKIVEGCKIAKADVRAISASKVETVVADELSMEALTTATIIYGGDPKITSQKSASSGSIKKVQ